MTENDKPEVKTPGKTIKKIRKEQISKKVTTQLPKASIGSSKGTRVYENADRTRPLNNARKGTSGNKNRRKLYRPVTKGMVDSSLFIIFVLLLITLKQYNIK